ncbi:MAG: hypothetical protein Q8N02_10795 [Methylotenera sp.]|nr:hypothetical protein [Methylotenera sp.]MDO9234051.1 hypothetical protein [Methylotenera sp.]MDO9388730.1 hypothetical protein [Methylotenera sp.]MDP1596136.1 hypothetical protein [Methylotenera sp.]MDP1960556.1 hypothetical protein [Methylotenera sp.]
MLKNSPKLNPITYDQRFVDIIVQVNQLAASTFSLATQVFNKHSWRSDFHALAVILLEGDIDKAMSPTDNDHHLYMLPPLKIDF